MTRIFGDGWDDVTNKDHWEVANASVEDFDRALDQLDACTYTTLTVWGEGEQHLCIGGGEERYIVYATFDNEKFFTLQRPDAVAGRVLLFVGGQEGDYPASHIVSKDQARRAGQIFLDSRQLDPTQQWLEK